MTITARTETLSYKTYKTYLFAAAFVAGNLLLPYLCHLVGIGGKTLLPILFFTLIAACRYGIICGLTTAILSPSISYLISGMPSADMLPIVVTKSVVLAIIAGVVVFRSRHLSFTRLILIVIASYLAGGIIQYAILGNLQIVQADLLTGLPGVAFQVLAGFAVIKALNKHV